MGEASGLGVAHGSTAQGGEPGQTGLSPKQLKLAQRDMIRACAANQASQACQDAKAFYSSLLEAYNSQTPLPPIPRFKEVRPSLWEVVGGLGSCVLAVSNPVGWAGSFLGALGCAGGAKAFGDYMIPKQVRQ